MLVFISSVRRGLEAERDYLPALLRAGGHRPLSFEDFTAQPVSSRDACLAGVEQAEVYLLLLGQHYGEPMVDSGTAPTEEEFTVAKRRGIPILVFRKNGVERPEIGLTCCATCCFSGEGWTHLVIRPPIRPPVRLAARRAARCRWLTVTRRHSSSTAAGRTARPEPIPQGRNCLRCGL
jgi:hypothetical protein